MHSPGVLQLTFLITAKVVPFVAHERLRALPLASLIRLLLSVLDEAFEGGTFLRTLTSHEANLPVSPKPFTNALSAWLTHL